MNRPLGTPAYTWYPRKLHAYAQQVETQAGPWAGPAAPVQDALEQHVKAVTRAFREKGMRAGMAEARARGVEPGAKLYVATRADTEERLAVRVARLRAETLRRGASPVSRQLLAFAEARLAEVRAAVKNGATPPQAVADKPDVPRTEVPRWLSYGAFALSAIALLGAARRSRRAS